MQGYFLKRYAVIAVTVLGSALAGCDADPTGPAFESGTSNGSAVAAPADSVAPTDSTAASNKPSPGLLGGGTAGVDSTTASDSTAAVDSTAAGDTTSVDKEGPSKPAAGQDSTSTAGSSTGSDSTAVPDSKTPADSAGTEAGTEPKDETESTKEPEEANAGSDADAGTTDEAEPAPEPEPAPQPEPEPEPQPEPAPEPDPLPEPEPEPLPPAPVHESAVRAELPRQSVAVGMPAMSGKVIKVPAGGNLQGALKSAQPGDVIELKAGAVYEGNFSLPAKSGSGWIVIRSSAWQSLPEGVRVGPEDARFMATLRGGTANGRVLKSQSGATHYRIIGLEIEPDPAAPALLTALVDFTRGSEQLILDRSYVHSTPTQEVQRCVVLNSGAAAVINSYIDECHAKGVDSQAIEGWNGPGPYLIENNFLAGAGENIMFGGAKIGTGSVPSDITIRRNHIFKPLSWKNIWLAKNLVELKIAQRVLIEENVLENSWADGQVGFAVVIKSENRDKAALPYIATQDVTFRNNRIINSTRGLSISGGASTSKVTGKGRTSRLLIENNEWQTNGNVPAFEFLGPIPDLVLKQNTAAEGYMNLEQQPLERFVFRGNILGGRVKGSGLQEGSATLDAKIAPGGVFADNVIVGLRHKKLYPTENGNVYPESLVAYFGTAGAELTAFGSGIRTALTGVR